MRAHDEPKLPCERLGPQVVHPVCRASLDSDLLSSWGSVEGSLGRQIARRIRILHKNGSALGGSALGRIGGILRMTSLRRIGGVLPLIVARGRPCPNCSYPFSPMGSRTSRTSWPSR